MASAVAQGAPGAPPAAPPADAYTPHLKRVLKSYRAAATTSLHGPNNVRWSAVSGEEKEEEDESLSPLLVPPAAAAAPPPPAPQTKVPPPPLLLPLPVDRKSGGQLISTLLEGELISAFNVGGEECLCLPQIFNTILRSFTLQQIYAICDDFQVYCSRCTDDQLGQLKKFGILPYTVPSCGLIRRSDAERVCSTLLHKAVEDRAKLHLRASPLDWAADVEGKGFAVYHECFGGCEGLAFAELYGSPSAPCIQCRECQGFLTPRNFVTHVHRTRAETRTCHWGFTSDHWRHYLLQRDEEDECAKRKLGALKAKFGQRKRPLQESADPAANGLALGRSPLSPQLCDEEGGYFASDAERSEEIHLSKKRRLLEQDESSQLSYFAPSVEQHLQPRHYPPYGSLGLDPTVWYQWAANAARSSAFKPWQTDLCGLLVGAGKAGPTAATSPVLPKAELPSTSAVKATHKRVVSGHSNSLDSAEDALSCTSSASGRVEAEDQLQADSIPPYSVDLNGLQKVLNHHNLDCKVQKDVLREALKISYEYQQVVVTLLKQKRELEKELALRVRQEGSYPEVLQVKQEPIEDRGEKLVKAELQLELERNFEASSAGKAATTDSGPSSASTSAPAREPQSLIVN